MPLSVMAQSTSAGITSIVVSPETRDMVKAEKTGGETYDDLLPKLVEAYRQYDPHTGES